MSAPSGSGGAVKTTSSAPVVITSSASASRPRIGSPYRRRASHALTYSATFATAATTELVANSTASSCTNWPSPHSATDAYHFHSFVQRITLPSAP